jgi:16S rRNA G966 N2-methylase RsmD
MASAVLETALWRRLEVTGVFPYKRSFLPPASELFRRLREVPLTRIQRVRCKDWFYPGGPPGTTLEIEIREDAYDVCDSMMDIFTEEVRVASRVMTRASPLETWEWLIREDPARLVSTALAHVPAISPGNIVEYLLREAVYSQCWECTQFKPSLARAVWEFCAKEANVDISKARLLDPCAGWGDRFAGALSLGFREYVGIDPNPLLHPCYAAARAQLDPASAMGAVRFVCLPFEDAAGQESSESFDVCFTSPPFGTYELYETGSREAAAKQCNVSHHPDRWMKEWLLPSVRSMLHLLRPGGILALHLSDTSAATPCGPLVRLLAKEGVTLRGTVSCRRRGKRTMPLWIWMK